MYTRTISHYRRGCWERGESGAELPVSLAESIGEAGKHSGDFIEPIFARSTFFGGQRVTALSEFEPWYEFPEGTTGDSEKKQISEVRNH